MAEENSNKRIARNTMLLYSRSLVNLLIGLYTSRLTLDALGITDYGIYNVVGSLVALFGLFNGSLNTAISRFITYELGRNNHQKLNKVFSSSLSILFIFALIIFILGETVGLWAVNDRMVFPADRMTAVNWVYQISLITFLVSLLNVAYTATLAAHENFRVLATVDITLTVVRVICVILLYYVPLDRLIYFAGYCFLLTLASSGFYVFYCRRHYPSCRYQAILDKPFLKEMGAFYSWNLFGSVAWLLKGAGINVVINLFFGVLINAAQAVASQVSAGVTALMGSFSSAMQPQITKSYASGDYEHMWKLVFNGTRYSFFLLAVFILPLCFNIDFILSIWLKEIPAYTNIFVILFLVNVLAESYSSYLITVLLATGKIAFYQASVGTILLFNVPLSYLAFSWGYPPVSFLAVSIVLTIMALMMRLWLLKKMLHFSVLSFLKQVVVKTTFVSLLICLANCSIYLLLPAMYGKRIIFLISTSLLSILLIYLAGLTRQEKTLILQQIKKRITSLRPS